jgi:hypothetical protein
VPFDDVYLVTPNRSTASREEVAEAERSLGTRLPREYAEFATRFGEGDYCTFVRVYPPRIVAEHRDEFQQRVSEFFLWEEGHDILPRERVVESIIVADTFQGDELVFHPSDPDRLFVLPHGDPRIFEAGIGLEAALDWLCDSGELTAPIGFKWFESWTNRRRFRFCGSADFDTVRQALLGLEMHDHARHITDDDLFFEMFVPDLHGAVSLLVHLGEIEAFVSHDAGTGPAALRRITEQLQHVGLTHRPFPGSAQG